jgi:lycopene beta-cyclase
MQVYIETVLGIQDYRILAEEEGILPLTDQPFPRRIGQRIMTIGTLGGRIKPSSGYAFLRIQQDSAAIVQSLLRVDHPFDVPPDSRRYRLYDSGLLQVMCHSGEQIKPIFSALVENNPIERVFRFLDGTASLWEDLLVMASLPPWPFLRALFHLKVLHRV